MVYVYSFTAPESPLLTLRGHASGDRFGEAVVLDHDVDGDFRADILVGAPFATVGGDAERGYVELYSGATGALIVRHEGLQEGERFGFAVAFLGDMNGDGGSEYAIGAPLRDTWDFIGMLHDAGGAVQVYNSVTHAVLYTYNGAFTGGEAGSSLAGLGSTDGDPLRELAIGEPGYGGDDGRVRVLEGTAGATLYTLSGPATTPGERFGSWISSGGDIDKDGHAEIAVGGLFGSSGQQHGYVRIFRGSDGTPWKTIFLAAGSKGGYAFDGGGDANGDGWDDLVVGRPAADVDGTNSGHAEAWGFLHYQDDLGFGGPGVAHLSVYGAELAPGKQADLLLEDAPDAFAPAFLLVGFGTAYVPYKGGTLVPSLAPSLVVTLFTDAAHGLLVKGIPGGSGMAGTVHAYVQFLMPWAAAPQGIELSNAVDLEFLP